MPIIKILNRDYNIACGPGEEEKLKALAGKLDKRLQEVARMFKGANDSLIIVVAAIMLEDLVGDLQKQNTELQKSSDKAIPVENIELEKISIRLEQIYNNLRRE